MLYVPHGAWLVTYCICSDPGTTETIANILGSTSSS